MSLIVNLEEFAELCGVTGETMRAHFKVLNPLPAWVLERGDKGRGYKIDSDAGIAWWKSKRADEEAADADRQEQLRQLRFEHLGDAAEDQEALALSGKQRREEYAAVMDRIKLRRMMGELVDRAEVEQLLAHAAVEARRRLMLLPGEFAASAGLTPEDVAPLRDMLERIVEDFVASLGLPTEGTTGA